MSTDTFLRPAWLDAQMPREGRYVLGPLLGQGGMGEVREAWDVVLRRTVALKILKAMDPVSLIRFMHEAQIHARVAHPNICRLYDVESSEGAARIAMQLIPGGTTLADVAQQLTIDEILIIFIQVAEAVQAGHKLKLIHRDLKPSNILLERSPEGGWVPYVCDFGLAMILDEPALTYSQGVKGTPAYMAPEQIRGERNLIGPATDVYALGGTLYYVLFDQLPMGPAMDLDMLLGRRNRPLPLPKRAKGPLPRDLESVLGKCLEPDPALRFSSMAALAQELRRVRQGLPTLTQPPGFLERHLPFLRKHPKGALLASLAAAALILGLGLALRQLNLGQERRADWTRLFALEAGELENELRVEKMLPIHDLRPAYHRLQRRMASIRARMDALGPGAEGPGLYALGRARFLMGDYEGAQRDLEKAWNLGSQGPEVAYLWARALAGAESCQEVQVRFATGRPSPAPATPGWRLEALFRRGRGLATAPDEFARAILAYSQKDFALAATAAHASFITHPWHFESAATESLSLYALGRQKYEAGDLAGAEATYREAMEAAQHFLAMGQSDEGVHHAYLLAGRGLAYLQGMAGSLPLAAVTQLQRRCREALRLNPDDPRLQDDALMLSALKAMRLADLGQDPGAELAAALDFLQTRVKEPQTPELRADRMILHWQLAQHRFRRGQDPAPQLAEALRDPGHTAFLHRDFLGDILNFKAEAEAARGVDPRPTLDTARARFEPILRDNPSWSLCEVGAEAWLIRAAWEIAQGLDPTASLAQAKGLAGRALQGNPASAAAGALEGLAWALEGKRDPAKRPILLTMARERLATSLAHGAARRQQDWLRRELRN